MARLNENPGRGDVPPGTRRYGGWGILWLVILALVIFWLIAMWWR